MAIWGPYYSALWGPDYSYADGVGPVGGPTTYAMAALNTGYCARFTATRAVDIYSVKINFATVTSPGAITVRVETIDATTGKPSGTLYDANAVKTGITPVTGWQTHTFASAPTTTLTAGAEYGIVILTTTAGTSHTLKAYQSSGGGGATWPVNVLTAADGTTRANFAEVNNSPPCISLLLSDGTEDPMGMAPFVASAATTIYSTLAQALKVTVPPGMIMTVAGVSFTIVRTGTPAGNLRIRILDSADAVVANSTATIDKDSLLNAGSGNRREVRLFEGLVTLPAGTYRVVFDSASSVDTSNCYSLRSSTPVTSAVAPSGFITSATADVTAGPPISWTDSATAEVPPVRLWLNNLVKVLFILPHVVSQAVMRSGSI